MSKELVETQDDEEDEKQDLNPDCIFQSLSKDPTSFFNQISELNNQAAIKIKQSKKKDAIINLQQAEKMLELAASCGRAIDRNLIIVVLYNEACAFQTQWVLDKCSKYLDGVIYNIELFLQEEVDDAKECEALLVKRYTFLARCYLQYCAILSQLGQHQNALENAQKAANTMRKLFRVALEFCMNYKKKSEGSNNTSQNSTKNQIAFTQKQYSQKDNSESTLSGDSQRPIFYMKDEVTFAKLIIEQSFDMLQDMAIQKPMEEMTISEKEQFNEAKKQLYYWRNNPENNEKHLRKELKVPQQPKQDDFRSLLGIQNVQEWIENFNIGSIMQMAPLNYEDFSSYGEMIYEISKRVLLEKIIYLSISYFTIATEFRFVEMEKAKQSGANDQYLQTEEFKLSELYHLKAIEIGCKYITCSSPYINHLISSYHKHYNQNLDTIVEESFHSQTDNQSEIQQKDERLIKLKNFQEQIQKKIKTEQIEKQEFQLSETKSLNLEKVNEKILKQFNMGKQSNPTSSSVEKKPQIKSTTSKQLHQFTNQQNPLKQNSENKSSIEIIKLMLKPSGSQKDNLGFFKQSQYLPQKKDRQHSPNEKQKIIKRDSSPTLRTNTVPAFTFLQNALLYKQLQQQSQQSLKDKQNASATYSSLESSIVNNFMKKEEINTPGLKNQPQLLKNSEVNSSKSINQVQCIGQNQTSSKNSLNTLLSSEKQFGLDKKEVSQQFGKNQCELNFFCINKVFQNRTACHVDQCRTERSRELFVPIIQSQQNSRSPERKAQIQSSRLQIKTELQKGERLQIMKLKQSNSKGKNLIATPQHFETIQQLFKNNTQLMNLTKSKLK